MTARVAVAETVEITMQDLKEDQLVKAHAS